MNKRTPGKKEDKLEYLKSLNQFELPYLISDILSLKYDHENIKILEGPGDGRRDIQSKYRDNEYLIQCKFHEDPSKSSGSRELDEIIIALAKFNKKHGIFATTGKISPQAKREYLENYPNYFLEFIEGVNIVEAIFSDKILKRLWYDGEKLGHVSSRIVIPFLFRNLLNNEELKFNSIIGLSFKDAAQNITFEVDEAYEYIEQLEPYSLPIKGQSSFLESRLKIYSLTLSGLINFTSYSQYVEILTQKIIELNIFDKSLVAIRYGRPYFEDILEANQFKSREKFSLPHSPVTIIVNRNEWEYEQSFYVDTPDQWRHPKFIQMSRLSDYGRFNEQNNVICYVEYSCTAEAPKLSYLKEQREITKVLLKKSLAITGIEDKIQEFKKQAFQYEFEEYKYGPCGKVLFWEYPTPQSYSLDIAEFEKECFDKDFEKFKKKIIRLLKLSELSQIDAKELVLVLQLNGLDPLNSENSLYFRYIDLLESFKDIPSPGSPFQRITSFEVVWSINKIGYVNYEKFLALIDSLIKDHELIISKDIKLGYDDDNINFDFVRAKFHYQTQIPMSTIDFISFIEKDLFNDINFIEDILKSLKPEVLRQTSKYWYYELGIDL